MNGDLGWALGVLLRTYRRAAEEVLNGIPGGPRGYQVLASAVQELAGNQGVMATQLGIDRTVLTYLLDDLEAAGLVQRRPDPLDRRSRRVVATERGRAVWRERSAELCRVENHILSGLGGDGAVFRDLLQRAAAHADRLDPSVSACQVVEEIDAQDAAELRRHRVRS
ncbi:MarR family transcriptional regulator [Sphaerisporangium album]|uniref:MarR family transcriptional regulator n=1 Tax=Sphaerisporangium album TaxID=509200 RepID=A0A367FNA2_9ACTN|nr:MarR family transcriptional regulator [Sphaerisporangium album]